MKKTSNINLALYDKADKFDITGETDSLNNNMKIIDEKIASLENNGSTIAEMQESIDSLNDLISTGSIAAIDEMKESIDTLYGIINTSPSLSYVDESGFRENDTKYWSLNDKMRLTFNFSSSASGNVTITILRDGYNFKTVTTKKGVISIDLGNATSSASYTYTVSAVDSLGRDADNVLTFKHVLGGVELSSTLDNVIKDTIFSSGQQNDIIVPVSISYAEVGCARVVNYKISKVSDNSIVKIGSYNCGTDNYSSSFKIEGVEFSNPGTYEITLQGSVTVNGHELKSSVLSYRFNAISANTIATVVTDTNIKELVKDTDNVYITYRITTNITALQIANALTAVCKLYKNNELVKNINVDNISNGDSATWNIGRLTEGTYTYEINGSSVGSGNYNVQQAEGSFSVEMTAQYGSTYTTNGLVAYFDPNDMDNNSENPDIWKAKNSSNTNYYYFKLHDLNYNSNGWVIDEDGSKMLKFTGDSYGELRYVNSNGVDSSFAPMSMMTSSSLGNSLEVMFKTRCIGDTSAVVASCKNESINNYGGYSIKYDKAVISSNEQFASTQLAEDKWTHVVFVIDKNLRKLGESINNTNIEDMNTVYTMNIYVNGVRTKVISFLDTETFMNTTSYPPMQMLLNAYKDTMLNTITGFGSCEIKTIRIYNSALKASQVFTNYVNAQYSIEKRRDLINKNDTGRANIPIIRFVRNKIINQDNTVAYSKFSKDKSFKVLNSITLKKSNDPTIATSKNSWVNCTMWYTYLDEGTGLWNTTHYDDVDVYLQGTSSLQYPVKNYKINLYNSNPNEQVLDNGNSAYVRGGKNKIIPPNMKNKEGWYCKDSVFTLKCDYMEESHKNNTPTAMMYEGILDDIVSTTPGGYYTPAKDPSYKDYYYTYTETKSDGSVEEKSVRKYRDAIAGFPVLLYYNENDASDSEGTPIDYNTLSDDTAGYYSNDNDTMVGTLMFNVDKTGDSIGFKIPVEEEISIKSPIDGRSMTYTDGTPITLNIKPCISLEGTSNSSAPAAAAFYTFDEANIYIYKTQYLEKIRTDINYSYSGMSLEDFYTHANNGEYNDVMTFSQYSQSPNNELFPDVYSYISSTFEVRWAWTEKAIPDGKKLSTNDFNELTYGHIVNILNWISTSYNNRTKFRNEFSQHFNLAYCITYYLQMMTFMQVDNAGKNAMFDHWGDGILHPRPYDMDTQMGENNSGDDVTHTSAEINIALSPSGITGNLAQQANTSNRSTDANHNRYIDYNTPNSKLWIAFGTYFRDEIVKAYTHLRDKKVYDANTIVNYVNSITTDIIGETFYNKDAAAKYLTQTYYKTENGIKSVVDNMLTKLQGDRDSRYLQVIKDRLTFLDSFFGYTTSGNTSNTPMTLRSDAASTGIFSQKVGISVYSPCYITIAVGTDVNIVSYIDPDESYEYNGETYEGVLFTLPIQATNKDITIIGAGNIKSINHMENLIVTNLDCANAGKMTSIVITNSTALASLSIGSNTYLRTLNVSGSKTLSGNLNLSNCTNLKTIDISNTNISSASLPSGGSLTSFKASNCALTSISFNDLYFIDDIDISGCDKIISYEMTNCPKITVVDVNGYTGLSRLVISACENVTDLELSSTRLNELSITSCDNLNTINLSACSGTIMNELNLASIYGLKNLNISSSIPNGVIKIFLPKYKKEYLNLSSSELDSLGDTALWRGLKVFNASNSNLSVLANGIDTNAELGLCDFRQLTSLESLNIRGCYNIYKIKDINFSGNISSMFSNCKKVTKITGTLTSTTNNISSIFYGCSSLSDIDELNLNFNSVTNASSAFMICGAVTSTMVKKLLSSLPNVTNLSGLCYGSSIAELRSDLFEDVHKVTNLSGAFYATKIVTIPSGLFEPIKDSIESLNYTFMNCGLLTTVPNNIIKYCTKLVDVGSLFKGDYKLVNFFNESLGYDIFPEDSRITTTYCMFDGCTSLKQSACSTGNVTYGLKKMFDNLPNLNDARVMFNNVNFITSIPTNIFENNTLLSNISMMFANNSKLTSIPNTLFTSRLDSSVVTHSKLTNASGLFSNCINLGGQIHKELLYGAKNLTNIGHVNGMSLASSIYYSGGMFTNTKISGFEVGFLDHLTQLTSVSMLFFKGGISSNSFRPTTSGNNNDSLFQLFNGDDTYVNGIHNNIFKNQSRLQNASYVFAGNTKFTNIIDDEGDAVEDPSIFSSCKNSLLSVEGLFANCNSLAIDIPVSLLQNCSKLTTARSLYAGCTSLSGSLSGNILSGCTNLNRTDYMFYNCINIGTSEQHTDISVPSYLFDSCRARISNVARMFEGCGFKGRIGTGSATQVVNEQGVISYNINRNGLLSSCNSLVTAEGMFRGCNNLHGAIPEDIFFTPSAVAQYNNLSNISGMFDGCYYLCLKTTGIDPRNKRSIYGDELLDSDAGYLIPTNWLSKCPNITDTSYLFRHVACPPVPLPTEYYVKEMLLDDNTMYYQTKLSNVSYMFGWCKALAANLTAVFLQNSLNTITNASYIFAFSNLKSAGVEKYKAVFEKNTSNNAINTALTDIKCAFYYANNNNMTGHALTLSKFSKLTSYESCLYNQTKLSNYDNYPSIYKSSQIMDYRSSQYTVPVYNQTAVL